MNLSLRWSGPRAEPLSSFPPSIWYRLSFVLRPRPFVPLSFCSLCGFLLSCSSLHVFHSGFPSFTVSAPFAIEFQHIPTVTTTSSHISTMFSTRFLTLSVFVALIGSAFALPTSGTSILAARVRSLTSSLLFPSQLIFFIYQSIARRSPRRVRALHARSSSHRSPPSPRTHP